MPCVEKLLRYCQDWSTRASKSYISMMMVRSILRCIPVTKNMSKEKASRTTTEILEICAGIMLYAEIHMERLDKLYGNSFMINLVLHYMGKGLDSEEEENDVMKKWERSNAYFLPPSRKDK